jgi:hypothetical protein
MLGVVLELFIVEKNLLARGEHKFGAAVDTLEDSIGEFHGRLPTGTDAEIGHSSFGTCRSRFPAFVRHPLNGPVRTKKNYAPIELPSGQAGQPETPHARRVLSDLSRF